jgi:proteasome lid subunit RPN8/RPN11
VLVLAPAALDVVTAHAESAHPHECCGVLLGRVEGDGVGARRIATSAARTRNLNTERAQDRYLMDPADRLAAETAGRARGEAIVGFYHSHPEHDAYFSPTDLERSEEAQWGEPWVDPTYAYLVVSVRAARAGPRRAFLVVEGKTHEIPIA